jgi:vancomycin resistance protein YoaR
VTVAGEVLQPERTTTEARELEITEQVSTFTTSHDCCEPRVTNIHRIADILDGAVVAPGESIELNDFVGKRTREKGFVGGGAILRGEYIESVGGGISQFATTFFNAAYFGGYELVDYKPHSYYIPRYPVGREATINYPNVDLRIRNNSPHGLLIKTSYTSTSVTVTFYGTKWVQVDSIKGERRNYRQPDVRYIEDNSLPPGASEVVQQAGDPGFSITVTRVLRFPDGRVERQPDTTRYQAEDRIIKRNT